MSDNPVQLVVAAFKDEESAREALNELKQVQREKLIKIENAAVLRKESKGKLHIRETHDMGGGKGAALGGVGGAAMGLLAGPALIVPAAVGALVGGLTARLRDSGFSNQRLETLVGGLQPGTSAIVAVMEHTWVARVEEAMAEAEADVTTAGIQADIAVKLEAGHKVAYSAIASEEGLALGRVADGEDEVQAGSLVIDDAGVYGGRFVDTEDGFAVEETAVTDEGIEDLFAVRVPDEEEDES